MSATGRGTVMAYEYAKWNLLHLRIWIWITITIASLGIRVSESPSRPTMFSLSIQISQSASQRTSHRLSHCSDAILALFLTPQHTTTTMMSWASNVRSWIPWWDLRHPTVPVAVRAFATSLLTLVMHAPGELMSWKVQASRKYVLRIWRRPSSSRLIDQDSSLENTALGLVWMSALPFTTLLHTQVVAFHELHHYRWWTVAANEYRSLGMRGGRPSSWSFISIS